MFYNTYLISGYMMLYKKTH